MRRATSSIQVSSSRSSQDEVVGLSEVGRRSQLRQNGHRLVMCQRPQRLHGSSCSVLDGLLPIIHRGQATRDERLAQEVNLPIRDRRWRFRHLDRRWAWVVAKRERSSDAAWPRH